MISIIYDYQAFAMQATGGVSRYFAEIIMRLRHYDDIHPHLSISFSENKYLQEATGTKSSALLHTYKGRGRSRLQGIGNAANKRATLALFENFPGSIYHPTYFDPWMIEGSARDAAEGSGTAVPLVLTVHDMIHELFPDIIPDKQTQKNKKIMMEHADAIIAVSQSTRRDILRFYPQHKDKIAVIYHGTSLGSDVQASTLDLCPELSAQMARPYILFVGSRWSYKNFKTLAEICAELFTIHPDLQLICAGGGAFTADEKQHFQLLGIESHISQHSVSDTALKYLYQNALFFVFPSRYEGFGLPVLEAMSNGAPCLLSHASSLPEVGGDAALYFDPNNKSELLSQCSKLVADEGLRAQLTKAGYENAKRFGWDKCASEHAALYRDLIS